MQNSHYKSMDKTVSWDKILCYYHNLVHTIYREARHIGDKNDKGAKCIVSERYIVAAQKCRENRDDLKSVSPFEKVKNKTIDEVINYYETLTDLTPNDLINIFRNEAWCHGYGGEKWAVITEVLVKLKNNIENQDLEIANKTIFEIKNVRHNNGKLIPDYQKWKGNRWQKEKWPRYCEIDE